MTASVRVRRPFTVREEAHNLHRCVRCQRPLQAGEPAIAYIVESQAFIEHAARRCPKPTPPNVPTRTTIQGANP